MTRKKKTHEYPGHKLFPSSSPPSHTQNNEKKSTPHPPNPITYINPMNIGKGRNPHLFFSVNPLRRKRNTFRSMVLAKETYLSSKLELGMFSFPPLQYFSVLFLPLSLHVRSSSTYSQRFRDNTNFRENM